MFSRFVVTLSFLGEISSCRLTYENCNESRVFFLNKSELSELIQEISTVLSSGALTLLQTYGSFYRQFSPEVEKNEHVGFNLGTSKSSE